MVDRAAGKAKRVELDFSDEAYRRFQEIKALAGQASSMETIRDALRVYEWLLNQRRAGKRLEVVTPVRMLGVQIGVRLQMIEILF
jgi:IS1 family transposase